MLQTDFSYVISTSNTLTLPPPAPPRPLARYAADSASSSPRIPRAVESGETQFFKFSQQIIRLYSLLLHRFKSLIERLLARLPVLGHSPCFLLRHDRKPQTVARCLVHQSRAPCLLIEVQQPESFRYLFLCRYAVLHKLLPFPGFLL